MKRIAALLTTSTHDELYETVGANISKTVRAFVVTSTQNHWIIPIQTTSKDYPPASEESRGVYWNQTQKNLSHPYTEYPGVSVTLWLWGQ